MFMQVEHAETLNTLLGFGLHKTQWMFDSLHRCLGYPVSRLSLVILEFRDGPQTGVVVQNTR